MQRPLPARLTVTVVFVGAHAGRITGEDARPEALLVLPSVASLPRAATLLLCLLAVFGASAGLGVLRASGHGAHPVSAPPGHGRLQLCSLRHLGVVSVKQIDVPLGVVVAGLVLIIGCRLVTWWPGVIIGAALVLGAMASTARQRRTGPEPEVTRRPDGQDQPWRKRD
jgi:hypothetical protein